MASARILIVDDSASIRQLASFALKQAGFDTKEVNDGKEAVTAAGQDKFDVVLTDRNMPNMDGIELTKALRADANYKFTPILMLTTESETEKKQEGKAAGVTGWIIKPFNPDTLVATINKVIKC